MKAPEPLLIAWRGQQLCVRHDDPHLSPYSSGGATIRSAIELASDVEGLRLALMTTVGDRYRVRVSEDGIVVGLWRRTSESYSPAQEWPANDKRPRRPAGAFTACLDGRDG